MISFDQVLLLEQKVESAVAKIAQLKAENAALRTKCAELTNALSAKTEQFSAFQSDQGKIEEGILKALERLNTVENAVLSATSSASSPAPVYTAAPSAPVPQVQSVPVSPIEENITEEQEAPETVSQPETQPEIILPKTENIEQATPIIPDSIFDSANNSNSTPIQNNFDIW